MRPSAGLAAIVAGALFALDETGTALAGKAAASLFSALAGATMFLALRRWGWPAKRAATASAVFGFETGLRRMSPVQIVLIVPTFNAPTNRIIIGPNSVLT